MEKFENFKLIRLQSTLCERHCWDKIIQDLDYSFLFDLALGKNVIVYDTSRNKNVSRALYQGLEFVRYVLWRRWFDVEIISSIKGQEVTKYFNSQYKRLDRRTKAKIDYVKKFLNTSMINLTYVCGKSDHDGDYEYYRRKLGERNV